MRLNIKTKLIYLKHNLDCLSYILRHKWFVLIECCKRGIVWRGILHDLSKFRKDEWNGYLKRYYIDKESSKAFDKIRKIHKKRNKHHISYWIKLEVKGNKKIKIPLKIPEPYRTEILCDWIGGCKSSGKDIKVWYHSFDKNVSAIEPETKRWFDREIRKL